MSGASAFPNRNVCWVAESDSLRTILIHSMPRFVRLLLCPLTAIALMAVPVHAEESNFAKTLASAEKGDAEAQYVMGRSYAKGDRIAQNFAKAIEWYRKAAEQGNPKAQSNLGAHLLEGTGIKADAAEAVKWFRKAAEQGDSIAQYNLGLMISQGNGHPRDVKEASLWFEKAAQQGLASAQASLGELLLLGAYGIPRNYVDAAKWLRMAAEQGNAKGQNSLGVMLEEGLGMDRNLREAASLFRKAADQNHARGRVNLGRMYEIGGGGLGRDYVKAYYYYTLASVAGEDLGMKAKAALEISKKIRRDQIVTARNLAQAYFSGRGKPDFDR